MYTVDSDGQPLSGSKKYTMTFKEGIPYIPPGFWSLTMYDATNNYTVPNPLNRFMLGSDTPEMKKNADGSFTIYIQNDSPGKDKEANWLPAPPGPFYLIPPRLRARRPDNQDFVRCKIMAGAGCDCHQAVTRRQYAEALSARV